MMTNVLLLTLMAYCVSGLPATSDGAAGANFVRQLPSFDASLATLDPPPPPVGDGVVGKAALSETATPIAAREPQATTYVPAKTSEKGDTAAIGEIEQTVGSEKTFEGESLTDNTASAALSDDRSTSSSGSPLTESKTSTDIMSSSVGTDDAASDKSMAKTSMHAESATEQPIGASQPTPPPPKAATAGGGDGNNGQTGQDSDDNSKEVPITSDATSAAAPATTSKPQTVAKGTGIVALEDIQPSNDNSRGDTVTGPMQLAGGKVMVRGYVINMDEDTERLAKFRSRWAEAWPGLPMSRVAAVTRAKRGLGLALSYVHALDLASNEAANDPEGTESVGLFFEDDAVPFSDVKDMASDIGTLVANWPSNSSVVLLGGHHIRTEKTPDLKTHLTQIDHAYGTYAWMVRKQHMRVLQSTWYAQDQNIDARAVDVEWSELWKSLPGYIATPLLVDHDDTGTSHTWEAENEAAEQFNLNSYRAWQGKREWWKLCSHDSCDMLSKVMSVADAENFAKAHGLSHHDAREGKMTTSRHLNEASVGGGDFSVKKPSSLRAS